MDQKVNGEVWIQGQKQQVKKQKFINGHNDQNDGYLDTQHQTSPDKKKMVVNRWPVPACSKVKIVVKKGLPHSL